MFIQNSFFLFSHLYFMQIFFKENTTYFFLSNYSILLFLFLTSFTLSLLNQNIVFLQQQILLGIYMCVCVFFFIFYGSVCVIREIYQTYYNMVYRSTHLLYHIYTHVSCMRCCVCTLLRYKFSGLNFISPLTKIPI